MKKDRTTLFVIVIAAVLLQGCLADIRTDYVLENGISVESKEKGKQILQKSIDIHGAALFASHKVYMLKGRDVWKGVMGKMGKVWPDNETTISLKYEVGSFNSQVCFEDGSRKGAIAGLQSWKYYEKEPEGKIEFTDYNDRIVFALSAYQYFTELLNRLNNAPIVTYGGIGNFEGKEYELVMASWETIEPDENYDQYVLWINKETHFLEFAQYTVRESYLPGGAMFPAVIHYSNYKNIDGAYIPFTQTIYPFALNTSDDYLHRLTLSSFEFDSFNVADLKPDSTITEMGDRKL